MIDSSPIAILAKAECLARKLENDGIVRYFKDGLWGRRFRVSNTDWKIIFNQTPSKDRDFIGALIGYNL